MNTIHGGNWAEFYEERGTLPLDFSANVSPLGVPNGVQRALRLASADVDRYPDPDCRALRRALAEAYDLPGEWVLCGNGAADLIDRALRTLHPKKALLPEPTFSEYRRVLEQNYCHIETYAFNEEPVPDPSVDLVLLCEPNNPTGTTLGTDAVVRICQKASACGAAVLIDECFLDFLEEDERTYTRQLLDYNSNLLLLRAFTKSYALAGVRLGYLLSSNEPLLHRIREAGPPWAVSTLAQAAGCAALQETEYLEQLRALVERERPFLEQHLTRLGFLVVPSRTNFLLFQGPAGLDERLKEKNILIRNCASFDGLDDTWFRIAVRGHADNVRLLTAIQEVLA